MVAALFVVALGHGVKRLLLVMASRGCSCSCDWVALGHGVKGLLLVMAHAIVCGDNGKDDDED